MELKDETKSRLDSCPQFSKKPAKGAVSKRQWQEPTWQVQ
jgi:hypothetical protein